MNSLSSIRFGLIIMLSIAAPLKGQTWSLHLSTGATVPLGVFADTYSAGPTARLGVEYRFIGNLSAMFSAGYSRWPIRSAAGKEILATARIAGTLDVNGRVENVPLEFGLRYILPAEPFEWFLGMTSSFNAMSGTAALSYRPAPGAPPVEATVEEGWNSTGFEFRGGVRYPVSPAVSFEAVAAYVNIFDLDHQIIPISSGVPGRAEVPPQIRTVSLLVGAAVTVW